MLQSMFKVLVALLGTVVVSQGLADKLLSSFSKCHINNAEVNTCVLKALNSFKYSQLEKNNQIELPTLDPFVIPTLDVVQDTTLANYSFTGWNWTIYGLKNFDIKEISYLLSYDPATMTFRGQVEFGALSFDSRYVIKGHVVYIPVEGKGVVRVDLGPIRATVELSGKMIKSGETESYSPKEFKVRIQLDDQTTYFDGLFEQNKELARITNEGLNINSMLVAEAVTPVYEKISESVFIKPLQSLAKVLLHNEIVAGA